LASKRKVSSPLALAVMALLYERPMHPYEMVTVMRERAKHEAIRLRYSSLYSLVEALQREALIEPLETVREGRRPERTVYGLTDEGRVEFLDWLRELLSVPTKEYTQFAAGLSFLAALSPGEAIGLLRERARRLEGEVEEMRSAIAATAKQGVPRLFLVENEHELVLREAELSWVRGLVREIEARTLDGLSRWEAFHGREGVAAAGRGEEEA
jgi:DNA-binding PadR family transcriptional regulator